MNRFQYLQSFVGSRIGVETHLAGLEVGSFTTRLVVDGVQVANYPSVALEHQSLGYVQTNLEDNTTTSTHPLVQSKFLVQKGVIANSTLAKSFLEHVLKTAEPQPDFFHHYFGWCVVPSTVTQVELEIMMRALPHSHITWQPLAKAVIHQLTAQQQFGDTGILSVLDIGAEVTELSIAKSAISVQTIHAAKESNSKSNLDMDNWLKNEQLSFTLYWGTKDLENHLQAIIRDVYKVQLSKQAFRTLFDQIGESIFVSEHKPTGKLALRAQSLATGRPETVKIAFADIQPACISWFEYLTYGLSVLLQRERASWVSSALEQGIAVVGGGATVSDSVAQVAAFFDVPTTTIPQPREWTTLGLKSVTGYLEKPLKK